MFGSISTINAVTWSLEVEVQFYLAMPLLAYVFAIRSPLTRRGLLVAAMLIAGVSQAFWAHTPRAELTILYHVQFFLAGLLLADLYLARPREPARRWGWVVLSLAGWPLVFSWRAGACSIQSCRLSLWLFTGQLFMGGLQIICSAFLSSLPWVACATQFISIIS